MTTTTVCTIVSKNYLAYARTLMQGVARHHPDWHRAVLLVDRVDDAFDPSAEAFELVEVERLPLPHFAQLAFRYNQLELATAVKPWWLAWWLARGATRVVYLDPDVDLHAPLASVEESLDAGAAVALTPHLTRPLDGDDRPNDRDILQAGAYNLGFLAVRAADAAHALLHWWQARNEFDCVALPHAGLFVDQRWMDLAPGLFADVAVLRDEGLNVAYWNLAHRHVTRAGDALRANDVPLSFFHWSGLDPDDPESLSVHQTRHRLRDLGVVAEVARDYVSRLRAHGHDTLRHLPYAFARFHDGTPIIDAVRHHYRENAGVQRRGGDDPFLLPHSVFNEPGFWQPPGLAPRPLVTRAMRGLWELHPHLQARFPDPAGAHRRAYATFFAALHAPEFHIPHAYVAPVVASLAGPARVAGQAEVADRVTGPVLRRVRVATRQLSPGTKARARDLFRRAAARIAHPQPQPQPAAPKASTAEPSVTLVGHFHHPTGVGALARASRTALEAARLPHQVVDAGTALTAADAAALERHPIQLVHANADELPQVVARLGRGRFRSHRNVGVWAWELPELLDAWLDRFDWLDEVWAISGFVARAVAEKSPIPVVAMPPAVAPAPPAGARRRDFGLPEDTFLFLCACDTDSITARKNPQGAVRAFRRAFPEPRDVALVLKVHSARGDAPDPALLALAEEPGVVLLEGTRSRADVSALESLCDASLSLHRAEGFGLVPAECMALGRPAVATGWSGNLEYMTPESACLVDYALVELDRDHPPYRKGQTWAEPDLDHAAHQMRALVTDRELYRRKSRAAREQITRHLHPEVVGRRMRARLERLLGRDGR